MIVYVDLIFIINFIMDFYILSGVNFILNLKTKIIRIILASIFGSISLIILFLKLDTLLLNILKIIISIFIILISFGYKNFFIKIFYMYIISIVLGGFLYLINDSLGYEVNGLIFINKEYNINLILLLIISPLFIYMYIKTYKKNKKNINLLYDVEINIDNKFIKVKGFLDTGNKLKDPYFNRSIILLNKKYIKSYKNIIYVPFNSLNNTNILECIKPDKVVINNKVYNNILIGISNNLNIDCILNERIFDYEIN